RGKAEEGIAPEDVDGHHSGWGGHRNQGTAFIPLGGVDLPPVDIPGGVPRRKGEEGGQGAEYEQWHSHPRFNIQEDPAAAQQDRHGDECPEVGWSRPSTPFNFTHGRDCTWRDTSLNPRMWNNGSQGC